VRVRRLSIAGRNSAYAGTERFKLQLIVATSWSTTGPLDSTHPKTIRGGGGS